MMEWDRSDHTFRVLIYSSPQAIVITRRVKIVKALFSLRLIRLVLLPALFHQPNSTFYLGLMG